MTARICSDNWPNDSGIFGQNINKRTRTATRWRYDENRENNITQQGDMILL